MVDKVLKIDTIFGNATHFNLTDPLLLTELTGQEGISVPFFYELKMVRGNALPDFKPEQLIGTMVRIGVKQTWFNVVTPGDSEYMHRTGMVQHVETIGRYNPGGATANQLFVFKARVVPAFIMLGAEIRYRIFENQSAYDILLTVLDDMRARCPEGFRYNLDQLNKADLDKLKLEYCVQYGESTVAFLSRLMSRFGIWYTYDHDGEDEENLPPLIRADNETMYFGRAPRAPSNHVAYDPQALTDDDPDKNTIANFQHQYELKPDRAWAGNFNILDPTQPPMATQTLAPDFDLLKDRSGVDGYSISEEFPRPFDNVNGATEYVKKFDQDDEARVYSVSGGTKNTTFIAGRLITIKTKPNAYRDEKNDGDYLLKMVFLNGYEHSYLTNTGQDVLNFFFRDFLFSPVQNLKGVKDFTVAVVNAGLNNYLQNSQAQMFNRIIHGSSYADNPSNVIGDNFESFFLGGITQVGITSAISALVGSAGKVLEANDGQISNTFVAIPKTSDGFFRVPIPEAAARAVTYGPHTAVVIGPDGSTPKQSDHYADALGRVRVRFPWDPGPPQRDGGLPPSWTTPGTSSAYPFSKEKNTCWVRVSEDWAGRHYGTQFLPRIGQEVIVSFLDGDPERPIITGRVYNAANKGVTNLPFPNPEQKDTNIQKLSDLPGTVQSKLPLSGIKTWSIPTTDETGNPNPVGFHLLRFDDTRGKEQYLIRSQRRLDITALERRYESISSDRHLTVGGKCDKKHTIGGDYIAKIYRHYHLHVGDPKFPKELGNRNTKLEQDDSLDVSGTVDQIVGGHWTLEVGSNPTAGPAQVTINALGPTGAIVLNALTNITLTVGSSAIVLTPVAISITSPAINLVGPVLGPTLVMAPNPVQLPAELPLPALTLLPQEATPADPGDKLTPPQE